MTRRREVATVTAFVTLLTIVVTWPHAILLSNHLVAHHDPLLSIWRLGWIAHALRTAPSQLFNANIFYPAQQTLAFSDATMLQGLLGAPLFWAGAPPVLIYNLLLLAGFVGSGVATYLLARHLTGSMSASLVAAAMCTVLPYRIEHVMHLELQWLMFVPLTWLALHKVVEQSSWRWGVVAGVCFWLQVLACIYYGVFLAMVLLAFAPALLIASGRKLAVAALPGLVVAAVVAAVLTAPFALPYRAAALNVGARPLDDIALYSATPVNYLSTSALSWVWGWTADRWGGPELRLFPGIAAVLLGVFAVVRRPRRLVWVYLATTLLAIELSFGLNGPGYRWLIEHVSALQGFRALARFAAIGGVSLALLAAFGAHSLFTHAHTRGFERAIVCAVVVLMIADYGVRPVNMMEGDPVEAPDAYKLLSRAPAGVILELPLPQLDRLPGNEPMYEAWSLWHWKPLVNGYSGYYPHDYIETVARMQGFPDDTSVEQLRSHHVRYVVVHRALYDPDVYTRLMLSLAVRPELKPWGAYKDSVGTANIFELSPVD